MSSPAKRENVLQDLIKAMKAGHLVLTIHANDRMKERDVVFSDLEEAILNGTREDGKDSPTDDGKDWKYAVRGWTTDKMKDLRIIFFFDDPEAVVVTVIDKEK